MGIVDMSMFVRNKLARAAGMQYHGRRDVYETLGYKNELEWQDYYARYKREGVAARIVNAYPAATWRSFPVVTDTKEDAAKTPQLSRFDRAWLALAENHKINARFERADRLAGLGRFGVLLLGVKGQNQLDKRLRVTTQDALMFVSSFGERRAKIESYVEDPTDPDYGKPEFYKIEFKNAHTKTPTRGESTSTRRVHRSRIIHIAEGLLDDEVFGEPRLKSVWNYLDDLLKVMGGSSESVWRNADRGMQIDIDKDAKLDPADETKLQDELEEYMHDMRRYIRTRGVEITPLGSDVPNPKGSFEALMSMISGSTGIPQRILMGSERGNLASSQDRANWSERIGERQESFAEPLVIRPFVDRLIKYGMLPKPNNNVYRTEWQDRTELTEMERAEIGMKKASAIARIAQQFPGREVPIVAPSEVREWLGLPREVPDDMPEERVLNPEPTGDSEDEIPPDETP